jgi:hypothetical protein
MENLVFMNADVKQAASKAASVNQTCHCIKVALLLYMNCQVKCQRIQSMKITILKHVTVMWWYVCKVRG